MTSAVNSLYCQLQQKGFALSLLNARRSEKEANEEEDKKLLKEMEKYRKKCVKDRKRKEKLLKKRALRNLDSSPSPERSEKKKKKKKKKSKDKDNKKKQKKKDTSKRKEPDKEKEKEGRSTKKRKDHDKGVEEHNIRASKRKKTSIPIEIQKQDEIQPTSINISSSSSSISANLIISPVTNLLKISPITIPEEELTLSLSEIEIPQQTLFQEIRETLTKASHEEILPPKNRLPDEDNLRPLTPPPASIPKQEMFTILLDNELRELALRKLLLGMNNPPNK